MGRYGLRAEQWERIAQLLPGKEGDVGVTAKDNKLFVDAVLYRYRAGIPWRDLPERFGDPINIHKRFSRWEKAGEDQAIGRSRGGLSTKIHALVDALGNPTAFALSGGQAHDLVGADELLPAMAADLLIADKAFDADERVITLLAAKDKAVVIPPKANRKIARDYDRDLYKARHLIENFFAKLKQFRAIATRYDKTARNFLAGIHLTASAIWLN